MHMVYWIVGECTFFFNNFFLNTDYWLVEVLVEYSFFLCICELHKKLAHFLSLSCLKHLMETLGKYDNEEERKSKEAPANSEINAYRMLNTSAELMYFL